MRTYSNPTKSLQINDWPSGGERVQANFEVESNKKGERVLRTTTKNGRTSKPKMTTYATKVVLATGDDNLTYILEWTAYGFISVMHGNMQYSFENIHEQNGPERFAEVKALIFSI